MNDPQVLNTLHRRRDAINEAIKTYEDKLGDARHDLAHLTATIRLFKIGDKPLQFPVYMDMGRLFRPREIGRLCHAALAEHSPQDTRELALHIIRAKGMDEGDKVLRSAIAHRVVQALSMQLKRGLIASKGKRDGVRLWSGAVTSYGDKPQKHDSEQRVSTTQKSDNPVEKICIRGDSR